MSNVLLGMKVLRRLVDDADALKWYKAKLSPQLFTAGELQPYEFIAKHYGKFKQLPHIDTLESNFPEMKEVHALEVSAYYVDKLEKRFGNLRIKRANATIEQVLTADGDNMDAAEAALASCLKDIREQRFRHQLLDVQAEAGALVLNAYHKMQGEVVGAGFGWHYMDNMTGDLLPGDMVSFIGRPAMGKSWMMLYMAIYNWRMRKLNVLFVSMEMNILSVSQRVTTMYAGTPIGQLKKSAYSTPTLKKFMVGLKGMKSEESKFYVVDGNLAATVDDIYGLAAQLECEVVCIDGAYLTRNANKRLNRFERVAENAEEMKKHTAWHQTIASWQFSRTASTKDTKKGQKPGLEDIGSSDVIGQVSSVVLALTQEEGVETMNSRVIDVLKGRDGQVGKFEVNWAFNKMDFSQIALEDKLLEINMDYI